MRARGSRAQTESHFVPAVGGACREEAPKIGAGGQKNETGEQHECRDEGVDRAAEHVADQAGLGECELDGVIMAWVRYRSTEGIEFGIPHRAQ